jgi:glycosyltransferase involved in cell wall biosynthesis
MKVLHTESSLGWGGQELRTVLETEALMRRGHQVQIACCPESQFGFRSGLSSDILVFVALHKKRPGCVFAAYRLLKQLAPDIVVTHSSTDAWVVAIARCFLVKPPIMIRMRHVRASVQVNLMTRWMYQQAVMTVTTSEDIRRHLIERLCLPDSRVVSVPTGVDAEVFCAANPREREVIRLRLKMRDERTHVLMVSTLRSWKGHDSVLVALKDLPRVRLHIVGDGPQDALLRARVKELHIANQVVFWGHHAEVAPFYQAADLFLQPSLRHEGVSQSLLQAGACEIPVIASDIGGLNEVIEHEISGLLVEPGSSQTVFDAIDTCLKQPGSAARRARMLKARILKQHTLGAMADRMERIYEQAMTGVMQ